MVTLHHSMPIPKNPKNPQETINVDVIGGQSATCTALLLSGLRRSQITGSSAEIPVQASQAPTTISTGTGGFRLVGLIAAAVPVAEVDLQPYRPQLGMGHRHPDPDHQPGAAAAAHLADEVDAEDAEGAPQIKSIQEKYKKYSMRDPRKPAMNEEIAALYKKEGVNPVGGCLPMVIQMPFLFAYYRMLGARSICGRRTGSGFTICRRPTRGIFCRCRSSSACCSRSA